MTDNRMFFRQRLQPRTQDVIPHLRRVFDDVFLFHGIDRRHNRRHRQRMAGVGQATGKEMVVKITGNRIANQHPARRHIPGVNPFGKGHQIRHHAILLEGKPAAGTAKPGHHLIEDQHNTKLIGQRPYALHIAVRRHQNTRGTGNRLQQNGGNRARAFTLNDSA